MKIESENQYIEQFNLAERLRHSGDVWSAGAIYKNLLTFRLKHNNSEPFIFTINEFRVTDRLADFAILTGNQAGALALLQALADLSRKEGNIDLRVHVSTKILFVHLDAGNIQGAIQTIESLSDIIGDVQDIVITAEGLLSWERNVKFAKSGNAQDHIDCIVTLYDALAAVLGTFGRFNEALTMLDRSIALASNHISPISASRLLPMKLTKGRLLFQNGAVVAAVKLIDELAPVIESLETDKSLLIQFLEIRSKILLSRGELGKSYELLTRTIDLCNSINLPVAAIKANINLAITKIILNQGTEAIEILEDCLLKSKRLNESALIDKITRLHHVVEKRMRVVAKGIIQNKGLKKRPLADMDETVIVVNDAVRPADYLSYFEDMMLGLQVLIEIGDNTRVEEVLLKLRRMVETSDSELIDVRMQITELIYIDPSVDTIEKQRKVTYILNFLEFNNLLPELWQFRYFLSHTSYVSSEGKADWDNKNQDLLNKITDSLPPIMRSLYLLNKWSVNEEYLAGYANQLIVHKEDITHTKSALFKWLKQWRLMGTLLGLEEILRKYKDHLARSVINGSTQSIFNFGSGSSGNVMRLLFQSRGTLVLSYLVLPDRVLIISRSSWRIRFHSTFINRSTLRSLVFDIRNSLYPEGRFRGLGKTGDPGSKRINLQDLIAHMSEILQLEKIINEHKGTAQNLTFQADDVLNGFPFTLLTYQENNILDRASIRISIDNNKDFKKRYRIQVQNALLTGISYAIPGFKSLPGVCGEIENIRLKLEGKKQNVNVLMDQQATLNNVVDRLTKVDIAHFACHGTFNFEKPDQSGLALAEGEMLTLRRLLGLPGLSNLKLLVLSSCRGGEHFVFPGRWLIGLPETFSRAGVKCILAFLWPVDDDFAADFTSQFYSYLDTCHPADSFRKTIHDARTKNTLVFKHDFSDPKYWAGAIYYEQ